MATAKKLPSGNWRVNQYIGKDINGKRIYKSFTASTKREAEYLAADYVITRKEQLEDKTIIQALTDYIDSKSNTLSVSTIRGYEIIKRNAIEEIKNIKLCDINEILLQKWMNNNAAKYSDKTLRNQFGLIVSVLKQNKVNLDTKSIMLKPKQKKEMIIPTKEQMSVILQMVAGTLVELPVTLALTLGLRQSEIAGLHWEDYDGQHISIHRAVVPNKDGKLIEKETNKSYAGTRILDVPNILKLRLDNAERTSDYISDLIPSSVLRKFQKLCKENGLPSFKMHAIRHANASLLLEQGVPDKYAMERLGQSTPNMLKSVYQHTFKTEQERISRQVDNCFNDLCNTKCNT